MKIVELKQKNKEELRRLLEENKTKVEELRWLLGQKKIKNVREIGQIKKDIARILTILKEQK